MTDSINTLHGSGHSRTLFLGELARKAAGFAAKFGKGVSQFATKMQIGRMQSVLHAMSDRELETIGLERRDIAKHAEFLMGH